MISMSLIYLSTLDDEDIEGYWLRIQANPEQNTQWIARTKKYNGKVCQKYNLNLKT